MSEHITWHHGEIDRAARWERLGGRGAVVWLTGLSGSGKSSVAVAAEAALVGDGYPAVVLDGDNLRHGLCADLGFAEADRVENIRRVTEVAILFAEAGVVAFVPLVSPYRAARDAARTRVEATDLDFIEVFVDTPIDECERRDPKGLYAKARAGEIKGFTGIDDPYEAPLRPDLRLVPADGDAAEMAARVLDELARAGREAGPGSGPESGSGRD